MYTRNKLNTWLEEMLAEQLSNDLREAFFFVNMEESSCDVSLTD